MYEYPLLSPGRLTIPTVVEDMGQCVEPIIVTLNSRDVTVLLFIELRFCSICQTTADVYKHDLYTHTDNSNRI